MDGLQVDWPQQGTESPDKLTHTQRQREGAPNGIPFLFTCSCSYKVCIQLHTTLMQTLMYYLCTEVPKICSSDLNTLSLLLLAFVSELLSVCVVIVLPHKTV